MRAVGQADAAGGARNFFHRHHVRQIAHAGAAVFFFHRHAEQALLAELAPQLIREVVARVGFFGQRRDVRGGELGHAFAQHVDLFAEIEGQGGDVHGGGSSTAWRGALRVGGDG
ncbi:hypothetical protein D3C71_1208350 [compost metagenome]